VTSYIESAAGVAVGGRTGLTAVVVGILFLCTLFFAPSCSHPTAARRRRWCWSGADDGALAEVDWADPRSYPGLSDGHHDSAHLFDRQRAAFGITSHAILKLVRVRRAAAIGWCISGRAVHRALLYLA